jgi:CRP-like cAMP-binding protein
MDATRLNSIKLFAGLSDSDRRLVAAWATELSVPAGTVLMRETDYSYDILAIVEGAAEVSRDGSVLAELGPGDVVGELGVLTRGPRSATVTATTPLMLVRLTRWDIRHLDRDAPAAAAAIRGLASDRLRSAA